MKCEQCNRRPATLHFTQVINGEKHERHICETCAKEHGYMTYPEEGHSLHNLLAGLLNFDTPQTPMGTKRKETAERPKKQQCPKCELTISQFRRSGKFGCAKCYETFSDHLDPIFRRVHSGNIKHFGKIPTRQGGNLHVKRQIETYKKELQQLIEKEAFEKAAIVRDQIKELKQRSELEDDES